MKLRKDVLLSYWPKSNLISGEGKLNLLVLYFIPFTAQTRMSGIDLKNPEGQLRRIRKGAAEAIKTFIQNNNGFFPKKVEEVVSDLSRQGATPLVVAENNQVLGVIHLKDIVKGGIKQRFAELRKMGIKTVMITGDNPLTAAAIAAEAGVDDFMAEAMPEDKLNRIREEQANRSSGRNDWRWHQ